MRFGTGVDVPVTMVGDRDTLFEQPTWHLDVAALGDRSTINAHASLEQFHRGCHFVREPTDAANRTGPRDQLLDALDGWIGEGVDWR